MKKLSLFIVIAVITLISSNSCKKDFQPGEFPIPQELLDYYYFKPGTFWVYKNDKTGEIDTTVIMDARRGWNEGTKGDKYEQAEVYINSSLDGYTYKYFVYTQPSSGCIKDNKNNPCYVINCIKTKPGNYVGEQIVFTYFIKIGYSGYSGVKGTNYSTFNVLSYNDSTALNGTYYYSVCKFSLIPCFIQNDKNIIFNWAKNIGIIRKENKTDNENWDLMYYQIVK